MLGPEGIVDPTPTDAVFAAEAAQRSAHLEALALAAFAGVGAIALTIILGQALARRVALDATSDNTLVSLGMTKGQLVAAAVGRSSLLASGGSFLAIVVAIVVSPAFPVGLARRAEIHPGLALDWPVLAASAAVTGALTLARTALAAWHSNPRAAHSLPRPSRLADSLAGLGLPVPALAGMRMSLGTGHSPSASAQAPIVARHWPTFAAGSATWSTPAPRPRPLGTWPGSTGCRWAWLASWLR